MADTIGTRKIVKQLAGEEDLLLGDGLVNQERFSGTVPVTKVRITKVVNTINDMLNLDSSKYPTVHVTSSGNGGIFHYDGSKVLENDGGIIINGWVRQCYSAVNISWFADNSGTTDSSSGIQKAIDIAYSNGSFVYDTGGRYLVTQELDMKVPFIGSGRYSTVFIAAIDGTINSETFVSRLDGKELFTYDRPSSAVINYSGYSKITLKGFRIEGRNSTTVEDNALVNIESCVGIRASDVATNRYELSDITINGVHTALDLKGWIANIKNVFITSAYIGLFASEFNNIAGSIQMENVERGFRIYEGIQVTLESYLNEGKVMTKPDLLDNCTAVVINGLYREGTYWDNPNGIEIGCMIPIDDTVEDSKIECRSIELNGIIMVQDIDFVSNVYVKTDKVNGVTLNGYSKAYGRRFLKVTQNSKNVIDNLTYKDGTAHYTNPFKRNIQAPLNLWIDPYHERGLSGKRIDIDNVTVGEKGTQNLTKDYSIKIEVTDDGSAYFKAQMKKYSFNNHFSDDDDIVIGMWVYIPSGGSISQTDTSTQPSFYAKENTDDGTIYGSSHSNIVLDTWFFIVLDVKARVDMNYIGFEIHFPSSALAGDLMYIDSIFMVNGKNNINNIRSFNFMDTKNPFAFITEEGYLKYLELPSDDYKVNFKSGDRADSANAGEAGAFLELECQTDNDRPSQSATAWKFMTFPNIETLPTANPGVGYVWNDNNVLTLGS